MRMVQKKKTIKPEYGFDKHENGQDRPVISSRAKYIAILCIDEVPNAALGIDDARVVSIMKAHPGSKKLSTDKREALVQEVIDTLNMIEEPEEKDIAAKLFRLVFGSEEYIPPEYMNAVTEITLARSAEKEADTEEPVQRPFMIKEFSREIRQNTGYCKALAVLEEELEGIDEDIQEIAHAVLKTLFGKGGHKETMNALVMLEWIPSRIIDEYGPAGAILEVCELWQKLRDAEVGEELAREGLCALGAIMDDEIRATGKASEIISNLQIDFDDIHVGIINAAKLTQN
ncbi:hypothetical protein KKE92_06055 [Candidatus Micrarchaeota archaeon]|nr:hypothetical protein [Candidatus Micrarchaeota archaeon]